MLFSSSTGVVQIVSQGAEHRLCLRPSSMIDGMQWIVGIATSLDRIHMLSPTSRTPE